VGAAPREKRPYFFAPMKECFCYLGMRRVEHRNEPDDCAAI
jgi:hypothetical protein